MKDKLNVMVPVDFTPVSYSAIEFLAFLMDKTPINTHLVHVVEVNSAEWAGAVDSSDTLDKAALKKKEQLADQKFTTLKQHVDFSFTKEIVFGGLTTSLATYADEHGIDLIIMGTAGAQGWLEKVSGSEAQHVVRHTNIPVITIHRNASITPLQNLLWVADFKAAKQPEKSVATIKMLQQLFHARLHLLQVIDKEDDAKTQQLKHNMQVFAEQLNLQNYELHLHHNYEVPAGVRSFNEVSEMDLVLIGTHGRKGISHLFYGSIAETLVNHCIRPLMTYHLN
ncbi:universal stress protein [Pontibacter akesuensis]|uniref:Nucleotide-binding universal stress protein, UspA family n=1 Tax=Pontibacter akesuensis TaxID=388950 RepID=A0A1I7KQ72_9BACT|nr:universal stress protein [Pontibacter akesuensis]GHA81483.1 universal stress protein UspA [Pontibacter akesuensis]SFU99559.1 Nucleotide-binding universal stress protein, UspA family [Pontibacter akesuensis]